MMRRRGLIRITVMIAAVVLVLGGLLYLDLANRGLAWNVFWSLTGEEEPFAQVRAMVEWAGNATRTMPRTAPYTPVDHVGVTPYGVNTALQLEADPAVRERSMQMIADAGMTWIRQQFPWEDIEYHGRGDFEDRRNVEAIGVVSSWDKYDQLVDLADQYGIQIQARVDTPPGWTRADNENQPAHTPPDDWQDYYNFLRTVAERYKGRILHYQIWNEPNIFPEWGNNPVNPEAYTDVLCHAYDVLKSVDPNIVVHSAALSPTISLTERDLSDLIFLQRMYDAGISGCFDVMSVQGYGFYSGPTDQRLRPTTINYARPLYIRDLMVANGDAQKPIWISEAAWNPVGEPGVPDDIPGKENFGSVTEAQAAAYMPLAYERATEEWNWIGAIMYWYWKRPDESERNQPFYYFRMVEPDMSPQPVYESMRAYIANEVPILYRGVHQADHRFIVTNGTTESATGAQFDAATRTLETTFAAQGTHVLIRWRDTDTLRVTVDGEERWLVQAPDAEGWTETQIAYSLVAENITVELESDTPFLLDNVSVFDRTFLQVLPPILSVIDVIAAAAVMIVTGLLRGRRRE